MPLLDWTPDSSSGGPPLLRAYFRSKRGKREVMHFRYPPYGTSAENPGTLDLVRYPNQPTSHQSHINEINPPTHPYLLVHYMARMLHAVFCFLTSKIGLGLRSRTHEHAYHGENALGSITLPADGAGATASGALRQGRVLVCRPVAHL